MSVIRRRPTQAWLASGFGAIALAACGTPDLSTNLRPEGPPDVLAVMVQTDEFSEFGGVPQETATFCKDGDEKAPGVIGQPDFSIVQICPEGADDTFTVETVTNADPMTWHARIVFDELLDPDFEQLTDSATGGPCTDDSETCDGHIAGSHPVDLLCAGQAVDYDGYYSPNGNALSWPPGPSIVVIPSDFIATGTECTVTVNSIVTDKDGTAVPTDQVGPYTFSISGLALLGTDPEETDPLSEVTPDYELSVFFNALIDDASVDAGEITLHDDTADADVAFTVTADGTTLVITPDAELTDGSDYTLTVTAGAEFSDVEGGTLTVEEDVVAPFTVTAE